MNRLRGMRVLLLVVAVALLAGCGGAPKMVRAEQELKPGHDAALIVFLAPMPVGGKFQLWDREHFIGFIEPASSVSYRAQPGEHMFLMRGENWQIVKGRVSAGKTYYIKIEPRVGVGHTSGSRASVEVMDPADKRIKDWMQHIRPLELADPDKSGAFEKKSERHVTKAIDNVESGRTNFVTLSASQGK